MLRRTLKLSWKSTVGVVLFLIAGTALAECPAYLDQDLQKLRSKETVNICKAYAGKPLLIVNTASHCGFTPQFKELEALLHAGSLVDAELKAEFNKLLSELKGTRR